MKEANYSYLRKQIESCFSHHIRVKKYNMIWLYVSTDANGVVIFTHITLKEVFLFVCIGEKSFHSCIQKEEKRPHLQAKLQERKSECMFKYLEKRVGFVPNTQHYYWSWYASPKLSKLFPWSEKGVWCCKNSIRVVEIQGFESKITLCSQEQKYPG